MRILITLFTLMLPGIVYGQEIKELLSMPRAEDGAYKVEIALEQKKRPEAVVLGADGVIYTELDGEWLPSNATFEAENLQLEMDKKSNIHITGLSGDGLQLWKSTDLGVSWEKAGKYTFKEGVPVFYTLHSDMKSGDLHLIYTVTSGNGESCKAHYYLVSTSTSGKKWTDRVLLNEGGASCENIAASMSSFKDGKLFSIWTDDNKFKVDRSYDGKNWLRGDIEITSDYEGGLKYGMPIMSMDNSGSQLQGVIYLNGASPQDSVSSGWIRKTGNLGDSWTNNLPLTTDFSGAQYFPDMSIDHSTGVLYTAWFGETEEGIDVYLGYSVDGGLKFKTKKISNAPFPSMVFDQQVQPIAVYAHEGIIVVTWLNFTGNDVKQFVASMKQDDVFTSK